MKTRRDRKQDAGRIGINLGLITALAVSSAVAAELRVPTVSYPTIQSAIDAAHANDVVVVEPYTYVERIEFKGKNIIVRSLDPTDPDTVASTIIDGSNVGPVVSFDGSEPPSAALEGFTIQRGIATGGYGAGVVGQGTLASIRYNVIRDNHATNGGGITVVNGLIEFNTIEDNTSTGGGGGVWGCNGTIRNNTIRRNSVTAGQGYSGGGLCFCKGTIELNTIQGNQSSGSGGGLGECAAIIRYNLIVDNNADYDGGGVYGGLTRENSQAIVENNIIRDNYAAGDGGGAFQASSSANLPVVNNVLYGNTSAGSGGGACVSTDVNFYHNILWANYAPDDPQLDTYGNPSYSVIQNWPTNSGVGIITSDPLFVNAGEGDFHLQGASPAVDAGNPIPLNNDACLPPGLGGSRADIGAYGGPANCGWPVATPTPTPTPGAPPSGGALEIVLATKASPPFVDPDGGTVVYTFTWTSDGGDAPIIQGPTDNVLAMISEADGVTFDAGETWSVSVVATDDQNQSSSPMTGSFVIGVSGAVTFTGWVID